MQFETVDFQKGYGDIGRTLAGTVENVGGTIAKFAEGKIAKRKAVEFVGNIHAGLNEIIAKGKELGVVDEKSLIDKKTGKPLWEAEFSPDDYENLDRKKLLDKASEFGMLVQTAIDKQAEAKRTGVKAPKIGKSQWMVSGTGYDAVGKHSKVIDDGVRSFDKTEAGNMAGTWMEMKPDMSKEELMGKLMDYAAQTGNKLDPKELNEIAGFVAQGKKEQTDSRLKADKQRAWEALNAIKGRLYDAQKNALNKAASSKDADTAIKELMAIVGATVDTDLVTGKATMLQTWYGSSDPSDRALAESVQRIAKDLIDKQLKDKKTEMGGAGGKGGAGGGAGAGAGKPKFTIKSVK